jgi:DNA polymerase III subunit gamma/tau
MANYEPLFLKYRPQSLSDVLGQSSVKETLINAIKNKKIVHAYLLTGPRGSGKTSTARIIAKSLNCTNGLDGLSPTTKPCGKCESCKSITNSSSIDVSEIDAASHGGVEDARKLIEKVNLASSSGKYRVYIIDEVHMLSAAAFNALLKVIEEPPSNVVFILATTEEHKVMKTISSRCQQLRFNSINPADCLERLEYVSQKEKINIDKDALELIARHADGAMRDALSLLDQLSVFSEDGVNVTEDKVLEIVGAIASEELKSIAESIFKRDPENLIKIISNLFDKGKQASGIVQSLINYFLDILEGLHASSTNSKYEDILMHMKENGIENFELVQILDSLSELDVKLKFSLQNKNLLKAWLIKVCHRADILVIKDLLSRVEELETKISSGNYSTTKNTLVNNNPAQAFVKRADVIEPDIKPRFKPQETSSSNTNIDNAFLDYLSPGTKGMFVSSHAELKNLQASIAYITIPNKFKFLQSKLMAKQEELLSALAKEYGDSITSIQIDLIDDKELQENKQANIVEKQQIQTKPFEQISSGEACVNRPDTESFAGALQNNIKPSINYQETKLDETVTAALGIFGGKEL